MKKLMAANWKMNKTISEAKSTATELLNSLANMPEDREFVLFAPFTSLAPCSAIFVDSTNCFLGAQNFYPAENGAFTGEISIAMLKDLACAYVLTGHSERRAVLKENDDFIGEKTSFAVKAGLKVILCIGETLEERESGNLEKVLSLQLEKGLANALDFATEKNIAIAYEPVWAIGTGKVAGSLEIEATHALIRNLLKKHFKEKANKIRILYGGSVNENNASSIIKLDNVDGLLVGGASLDAKKMNQIVLA